MDLLTQSFSIGASTHPLKESINNINIKNSQVLSQLVSDHLLIKNLISASSKYGVEPYKLQPIWFRESQWTCVSIHRRPVTAGQC